jgi:hypothetical protein
MRKSRHGGSNCVGIVRGAAGRDAGRAVGETFPMKSIRIGLQDE